MPPGLVEVGKMPILRFLLFDSLAVHLEKIGSYFMSWEKGCSQHNLKLIEAKEEIITQSCHVIAA